MRFVIDVALLNAVLFQSNGALTLAALGVPLRRTGNELEGAVPPVAQPDGSAVPITGPAAKLSRTPVRVRRGAPALGANTDEILEELGVDAAARQRLRQAKII